MPFRMLSLAYQNKKKQQQQLRQRPQQAKLTKVYLTKLNALCVILSGRMLKYVKELFNLLTYIDNVAKRTVQYIE